MEKAKKEIGSLIQKFNDHLEEYNKSAYNEAKTRQDFIDPFFKALGWDVENESSLSEAYREVIHEDKVKIESKLKSPDYSFRVAGKRYFFVEAKKPFINIKTDPDPAFQIRRYAWSAKLRISVVSNFKELAIYRCETKPNLEDKASVARLEYLTLNDYMERFDFLWNTFSREAVSKGRYDDYIKTEAKRGSASVDDEFVESLDLWRTTLAKDIFKSNSGVPEELLNQIVQNTIDRIIFLRIAEDRGVENYGNLKNCLEPKAAHSVYKSLLSLYHAAHDKFNSGLFDFEKDKVSKEINISNACLTEIIENLYFPRCPYEFSVMPVEILGTAYEQFLGKTIQIRNNRVVIEEKPEVRKAGGVYYTPQTVVDYIISKTVGALIDKKSPKQITSIKILDPASGSGSFLLSAYDSLLKYHLDWYQKHGFHNSKGKKNDPLNPDGTLTTELKKQILINNIFGVDVDPNAVEVTKLSLLLKCLEGETQASIKSQLNLFNERALPGLDENIKCGNSLVDTNFYEIETSRAVIKKIKPFNWQSQFPQVFKNGGFDAVVGNPPYVIIFDEKVKAYVESKFPTFKRNNDFYVAFLERGIGLLAKNGMLSFIVPNTFLTGEYFKALRLYISKFQINEIVNFQNKLIFADANVFTSILNVQNSAPSLKFKLKIELDEPGTMIPNDSRGYLYQNNLIAKLEEFENFDKYFLVKDVGYNYWSIGRGKKRGGSIGSRVLYKGKKKNKKDIPFLKGANIERYKLMKPTHFLRGDYKKFLKKNDIFRFTAPIMEANQKIIYRQTSSSLIGSIDTKKYHNDKTVHIILPKPGNDVELAYVLGVFNSKLLNYYYSKITNEEGRAFAQVKTVNVKRLPYIVDKKSSKYNKIIDYVVRLIKLKKSKNAEAGEVLYIESQIDNLVYQMYGLTADEIQQVKGGT